MSRADYCRQQGLNLRTFNGSPVTVIYSVARCGTTNYSLNDTVLGLVRWRSAQGYCQCRENSIALETIFRVEFV